MFKILHVQLTNILLLIYELVSHIINYFIYLSTSSRIREVPLLYHKKDIQHFILSNIYEGLCENGSSYIDLVRADLDIRVVWNATESAIN